MISIIYPPEAGSNEELQDFLEVIQQYDNRKVPNQLQEICDTGMHIMMCKYLRSHGIHVNEQEANDITLKLRPVIKILKKYFNRKRPDALARDYNIDWNDDFLDSAQSPSYPSGHTIQAYFLAGKLSEMFPNHSEDLFIIAEMISQSRIDRGVHFPTDIEYGKIIAGELLDHFSGQ
jgi:acid phosphatase (class A)